MNSPLQIVLRSRCARFSFRPAVRTAYYSTVAQAVESPAAEEPDKLYRTISIEMRANEEGTMISYTKFATTAAKHLDITVGKCYKTPTHYLRSHLCLLRSGFANKNCRVQYEVRTYYKYMTFHNLTGSTADTFLEYIERNLPEGIALKITKVEITKLPEEVVQPLASEKTANSIETTSDTQPST